MRIGIWCDYSFTLAPSEGIGVFVDNLARGILEADPNCELVLKCNHKDWQTVLPLTQYGHGRVTIDCGWKPSFAERKLSRWVKKLHRLTRSRAERGFFPQIQLSSLLGTISQLFVKRNILKHFKTIDACDAWIVPYVGLDMKFHRPNIVVVHDLVCHHFPEMMNPRKLEELMTTARNLVDQSTLVACMSNFIRDNDIKGVLHVEDARIRVIKPAVPKDIMSIETTNLVSDVSAIDPRLAGTKYLLYPSAFRVYKNHELLLKTVRALKDRGEDNWQIVFTGIRSCPSRIANLSQRLDIEDRIVCLGKVSREHLYALYKNAFATVVPSRYEQGSFPIMEALACGCPAIASDIPSLREQFEPLGESMLYANPDSVEDVLYCLDKIARDRSRVVALQSQGFTTIKAFSWKLAAIHWLDAIHNAIEAEASNAHIGRNSSALDSDNEAIAKRVA